MDAAFELGLYTFGDLMPEAHRRRVKERGIHGMAIEVHGAASWDG